MRNNGGVEGTYSTKVQVDGDTEKSETVSLAPDTAVTRSYQVTFNETGTRTVEVGDKDRSVTVNPTAPDENTALLIVVALLVAIGLAYVYMRD